jgi:hypothetical protein
MVAPSTGVRIDRASPDVCPAPVEEESAAPVDVRLGPDAALG